jgi:hypothetical protein
VAVLAAACDVGAPADELYDRGLPVHLVTYNVGTNTPLQVGQPVELGFDRLLLPITVTRQTFILVDEAASTVAITFAIAYDPVARVVTLTPEQPLSAGHTYNVSIESPNNPTDSTGLHAIDGATMDPETPRAITFQVVAATGTPPVTCNGIVGPCMSFCADIQPIFEYDCTAGTNCHLAKPPPLGLGLYDPPDDTASIILATAINRLSVESTMGALSEPGPPSFHFGQDMPIIDTTTVTDPNTLAPVGPTGSGDPGDSFLIYKVLMAEPGGSPPPVSGGTPLPTSVYSMPWDPLSDGERATLASLIPGREMPLPSLVGPQPNPNGLPVDSLERLSLWIAQGAPLSNCP